MDTEILSLRGSGTPCCPVCNSLEATLQSRNGVSAGYGIGVPHYWLYCLNCKQFTALIKPTDSINETELKKGDFVRYYTIEGKKYPSVTSVLAYLPEPPELAAWKQRTPGHELITARRAAIGTILHYRIGHWFAEHQQLTMPTLRLDQDVQLTDKDAESLDVMWSYVENWLTSFQPHGIAQDMEVFSASVGYAGSLDLLCTIKGELCLVDFKTGKTIYEKYPAQLEAYRRALVECTGGARDPERMFIARFNEKGAEFTPVDGDWELFTQAMELYTRAMKKVKI
jgi:hypothetical protein